MTMPSYSELANSNRGVVKGAVHTCMPMMVREPQLGRVMDDCAGCAFLPKMRFSKSRYNRPVKNINRPPQVLQNVISQGRQVGKTLRIYIHCAYLFDLVCR